MTTRAKLLLLGATAAVFTTVLQAATIVTIAENPNAYNSTLLNASVYTFDNLNPGQHRKVGWDGVGTFDQLYVLKANQYGGAPSEPFPNGSPYSVQGVGSPVKQTVLTLDKPSSYFGLYWSAGDAANKMSFFDGTKLVAEFTTANLMRMLPAEYYGNPLNRSLNRGEPYGFINFYADTSTKWDRIVFANAGSSGFESDNYTSRAEAWSARADGALDGRPVAIVDGATVTKLAALPVHWQAPAAPIPPIYALVAFAAVAILRGRRLLSGRS